MTETVDFDNFYVDQEEPEENSHTWLAALLPHGDWLPAHRRNICHVCRGLCKCHNAAPLQEGGRVLVKQSNRNQINTSNPGADDARLCPNKANICLLWISQPCSERSFPLSPRSSQVTSLSPMWFFHQALSVFFCFFFPASWGRFTRLFLQSVFSWSAPLPFFQNTYWMCLGTRWHIHAWVRMSTHPLCRSSLLFVPF